MLRFTKGRALIGQIALKNGAVLFDGTAAPTDGVAGTGVGFAVPGSIYLDVTNGVLYYNTGTKASPAWNNIAGIAPAEISLADGSILVGQGTGLAGAKAMTGDVTVTNGGVTAIGAKKVVADMIAAAAGVVLVGTKTDGDVTALDISAKGAIPVGQGGGETVAAKTLSGHATMDETGAVTLAGAAKTAINGLRTYLVDGLLQIGTLAISAAAEKFKTTTELIYTIAGLPYTKVATDNLVFAAADAANTINTGAATTLWGVWLIEINAAGVVLAKPAAGAPMVYGSEALAIAALPTVTAGSVQVGYITVQNLVSVAWVGTTSNLTVGVAAGNCTARNFYDLPGAKALPAAI